MTAHRDNVVEFPSDRRRATRLVPLSELIAVYGFSERWWRYRIAEGLPKHAWGRRLRFNLGEVERWMEARYAA